MYAVIRTGGKQYTVKPGDVLQVGKLEKDLGAEFGITDVLLVGGETTLVGAPLVKDATVTVVVTKQAKTRKIDVFKKKRRHSYRKHNTHRQDFTELFVKSIAAGGKTAKSDETPVVKDMAALRADRIKTKQAEARARVENKGAASEAAPKKEAKAAKKPAKKAAAKKGAAKKTAKKSGAKKAVKKTKKS